MVDVLDGIESFSGPRTEAMDLVGGGRTLQKTETQYTTAVQVQKPRQIAQVEKACLAEAKVARDSFYFGWEVKNKDGSKSWIEGPTIDLAMCIARHYGNCAVDVAVEETGTHFLMKGVFVDLESGFTCPRLFRQRKSQSMGGKMAADRQEDIVFQIGQSKAIRNAIIRAAPQWLVQRMLEAAKGAVRQDAGENLEQATTQAMAYFSREFGVTVDRLERAVGKEYAVWSADDIMKLRGTAGAIKENRISVKEAFPTEETAEETIEVVGVPDEDKEEVIILADTPEEAAAKFHKQETEPPVPGDDDAPPEKPKSKAGRKAGSKNKPKEDTVPDEGQMEKREAFERQVAFYVDAKGLPLVNRVLAKYNYKYKEEVVPELFEEIIKVLQSEEEVKKKKR